MIHCCIVFDLCKLYYDAQIQEHQETEVNGKRDRGKNVKAPIQITNSMRKFFPFLFNQTNCCLQ
jgi:hypothetical protein